MKRYMFKMINTCHVKQGTDSVEPTKYTEPDTTIQQEQTEEINITNKRNYNRYMRKMQNTKKDSSLH